MSRFMPIFVLCTLLISTSCQNQSDHKAQASPKSNTSQQDNLLSTGQVKQVVGIGLIEPESLISHLSVRQSGKVKAIYHREGDQVKAGDPILKLDDTDEQLALKKTQQEIKSQQFRIQAAQSTLQQTTGKLQNQEKQLKTSIGLKESGAETQQNIEELQTQVKSLRAEKQRDEANLHLAKSQLAELRIGLEQARDNLDKTILKAPEDGSILQIKTTLFSTVQPDQNVVDFAPSGPVIARCEIDEMFANDVKPGQLAEIRHVGFNKVIARGKVISASPYLKQKSLFTNTAAEQQDRRVREVRILLNTSSGLLFNSRVECTILLQKSGKQ